MASEHIKAYHAGLDKRAPYLNSLASSFSMDSEFRRTVKLKNYLPE